MLSFYIHIYSRVIWEKFCPSSMASVSWHFSTDDRVLKQCRERLGKILWHNLMKINRNSSTDFSIYIGCSFYHTRRPEEWEQRLTNQRRNDNCLIWRWNHLNQNLQQKEIWPHILLWRHPQSAKVLYINCCASYLADKICCRRLG